MPRKAKQSQVLQTLQLLVWLYLFFVSISLLSASLQLFGEDRIDRLLSTVSDPFVGLFVGILGTSIVQSSSTITSITVGLVAGGGLEVSHAIPIVIGANVGTSVTNALVAVGHIRRKEEFQRAFAAAVVDDFFELCSILILFPLELHFQILERTASFLSRGFSEMGGFETVDPLEAVVAPAVDLVTRGGSAPPFLVLLVALALLFLSLRYMVSTLKQLFIGSVERFIDNTLFRTALRALTIGFLTTALIQSSSMTTSLAVPLAGAGFLTLEQVFPYALGANLGTTLTALLAALVAGEEAGLTVAFSHLLYNVFGIALIWPIRFVPIRLARLLAEYSVRSRLVPLAYVLVVFLIVPMGVIALMR